MVLEEIDWRVNLHHLLHTFMTRDMRLMFEAVIRILCVLHRSEAHRLSRRLYLHLLRMRRPSQIPQQQSRLQIYCYNFFHSFSVGSRPELRHCGV